MPATPEDLTQAPGSLRRVTHDDAFAYVLPHRVDGTTAVRFRFRVRKPLQAAVIRVGTFTRKVPFLQPNQMASVLVPAEHLTGPEEVKLCLDVT